MIRCLDRLAVFFVLTAIGLNSCSSVPLSGRSRVNLVSDTQVLASSAQTYSQFIRSATLSSNREATQRVLRVGQRIAVATERYLAHSGLPQEAAKFRWEFNLIRDPQLNAWCMPGGKIVVYEGLLPIVPSDDDLATVLAHEVAHAMAKHANERMSNQILTNAGGRVLGHILGQTIGAVGQVVGGVAYDAGMAYFVSLPFSREHEYEADRIGLYLMALAGYDYTKAGLVWQRMASRSNSNKGSMLSTHPSDMSRLEAIEAEIPKVRKFMENGGKVSDAPSPIPSRNKQVTTNAKVSKSSKRDATVIIGNSERKVPLKTKY